MIKNLKELAEKHNHHEIIFTLCSGISYKYAYDNGNLYFPNDNIILFTEKSENKTIIIKISDISSIEFIRLY